MSEPDRIDEDPNRPRPSPMPFYGVTWVDHSGGYALRRTALGLGAVVLAAAGALVLRFAYEGLAVAAVGGWVRVLAAVGFALCSALAFARTLSRYARPPEEGAAGDGPDRSLRSIMIIGFVGVLLAYAVRSLVEAPGEQLRRAEYEQAVRRYERRRSSRTGNPAKRRRRR